MEIQEHPAITARKIPERVATSKDIFLLFNPKIRASNRDMNCHTELTIGLLYE